MKKLLLLLVLTAIIILSACNDDQSDVVKNEEGFNHPEWSYNLSIYEVNVRQYTKEGTFKAFEEHLPRLKEMGVGILWFMPIHPIGEVNRKGTLGSYYSVKDFEDVNPEFGTLDDFKSLVKKIHELGMYVIIDWVANHSAWDNKLVNEHPEFYMKDSTGNFMPPEGTDWSDVIDFDYSNKELWRYMNNAMKFWVSECDIDGFRCDVASWVPIEFWNQTRNELNKVKNVFMLAEAHDPELHEKAFDMTYNWQLKDIINRIGMGENDVSDLREHFRIEKEEYPLSAFRMNFITNHDENSWNKTAYERLGGGVETFAVLTGTVPGMMLVYSGQEAGLDKALEFFEKDPIEWEEDQLGEVYSKLYKLKRENKALWNGEMGGELNNIPVKDSTDVMCFVRNKDDNSVLALFNFSDEPKSVQLNNEMIAGSYTNLKSGMQETISSSTEFKLDPWEYQVFYR